MARILVVGSVARDEVVFLHDPLREGTHLEGSWRGGRLGGGASCVAVPLAHAGHDVGVIAALGTDALGDALLDELAATGVNTDPIIRLEQPSTRSLILLDRTGERTVIKIARTRETAPPNRLVTLPADCVFVRSRTRLLSPLLGPKAESALVIAHVPPTAIATRPAHVLIASASDVDPAILADPWTTGQRIAGSLLQWMIVTRGEQGATAYGADRKINVPAPRVRPIDTTGAGDSFAAGLVDALVGGARMDDALEQAVTWGTEATLWESSALPATAVDALLGRQTKDVVS